MMSFFSREGSIAASAGATEFSPAWGPSGQNLAFSSDWEGDTEVFVSDPSGRNVFQITRNDVADHSPAWSPDGMELLFVSHRDGNSEIYLSDKEGKRQENVTNSSAIDALPSWSPTGDIVFVSDRGGGAQLYLMRLDGSAAVPLTSGPGENYAPEWSPDGASIAFTHEDENGSEVRIMEFPSGRRIRALNVGRALDSSSGEQEIRCCPAGSPDGTRVAFVVIRDEFDDAPVRSEVRVVNVDGSGFLTVWKSSGRAFSFGVSDIAWSPGHRIIISDD